MSEASRALPMWYYRDPQEVATRRELDELGCHACSKLSNVLGKAVCNEKSNEQQKGVPFRGHLCKWFNERD